MTTEAMNALYAALAAAQGELKNPEKTKDGKVKGTAKASGKDYEYSFKYADIGDVLETILPVLSKHGLSVMQPTRIAESAIILVTRVAHKDGGSIESEYPVCSLNGNHQAMGAALTYARRYALTSLIGVAAVDDTDGEGAADVGEGPRVKLSAHQAKTEINWEAIQDAIHSADTFEKFDKLAKRVEERKGFWPDSYYSVAKEKIFNGRIELADLALSKAKDADELQEAYVKVEGALEKKVAYDNLAGLLRKHETRLEAETFPGDLPPEIRADLRRHPINGG